MHNPRMAVFAEEFTANTEGLKQYIVEKSSGVFLWTVLVVRSLMTGLRNHDTVEELRKRLDLLPPELDQLYRHMIKSMHPLFTESKLRKCCR